MLLCVEVMFSHSMILNLRILTLPVHRLVAVRSVNSGSRTIQKTQIIMRVVSTQFTGLLLVHTVYRAPALQVIFCTPWYHPQLSRIPARTLSQIQFVCTVSHQIQAMPISSYVPASQPPKINFNRKERKNRKGPPPCHPNIFSFTTVTPSMMIPQRQGRRQSPMARRKPRT